MGAGVEDEVPQAGMRDVDLPVAAGFEPAAGPAAVVLASPRPGVALPKRGQHVEPGRFGATIGQPQPDQNVVGAGLGIFDLHVEISAIFENAGVEQLELGSVWTPPPVFVDQAGIGELGLRIFV